jgi:hypothetical protein
MILIAVYRSGLFMSTGHQCPSPNASGRNGGTSNEQLAMEASWRKSVSAGAAIVMTITAIVMPVPPLVEAISAMFRLFCPFLISPAAGYFCTEMLRFCTEMPRFCTEMPRFCTEMLRFCTEMLRFCTEMVCL